MNRIILTVISICSIPQFLFGDYPLIQKTIISLDSVYKQQQEDVESWYAENGEHPPLALFRYVPPSNEDLFTVAAAFNLTYETLATLNGWDTPVLFSSQKEILVPNCPGIFIPENPTRSWDKELTKERQGQQGLPIAVAIDDERMKSLVFFPGSHFTAQERISFLGNLFSAPVKMGILTSGYGYRADPFSGKTSFHPGIDIEVDIGTHVTAARDGIVTDVGTLELYGHYVLIDHEGNYQTFYAHLDKVLAVVGQKVHTNDIIARSGNSGISTGPHLHFEIRRNGKAIEPLQITALRL